MRIQYNTGIGLVIAVGADDPQTIIRTAEVLIKAFEDDCDVSFLRWVLDRAKEDFEHTLH